MLSSQGLVLATAMAVSAGTIIVFDLLREKYFPSTQFPRTHPQKQLLKSCLSSGSKNRQKKKKKKVQFAGDVKDSIGDSEVYRKKHRNHREFVRSTSCGTEILESQGMPANHVALYSGILKNRVQRMENSY
ncbi:uncharacterized protein LOC111405175 [Olea europaea var. sylvestris]|uniref:uncharacterized protein LOC111405175 n=1 Tax=Olea europaea var. sylvestris TaxID=158386 RepID=UPI000C1D6C76|nr:uncharacterized protein LOC111405175 [Olea europaea var. sylvestris]